jgi:fatty acid desaturase
MSLDTKRASFSVSQARELVDDLFEYNAWFVWADLFLTLAVGYGFGTVYLSAAPFSFWQVASFFVAGFALFRVGSSIHDVTHMRRKMLGFRVTWNLLCGIPLLMPSFFYDTHLQHHNSHSYGGHDDGEYLPMGVGPVAGIFWFFAQVPVMPLYIVARFLISPLTYLHPRLRLWVLEHCSSFVINFRYRRPVTASSPRRTWALMETACFLRAVLLIALVALGFYPWTRLLLMYLLATFVLGLNYIRTLAAHHYRNNGEQMTFLEQLDDSVNITGHWFWTELFFPVGLRYHALHHLLPSLPYHNLGKAHRRLMAKLPADSPYRRTVYASYWTVVRELWTDARNSQSEKFPAVAA